MSKPNFRFWVRGEKVSSLNNAEKESEVSRWQQNKKEFKMKRALRELSMPSNSNNKSAEKSFRQSKLVSNEEIDEEVPTLVDPFINRQRNEDLTVKRKEVNEVTVYEQTLPEELNHVHTDERYTLSPGTIPSKNLKEKSPS